MYTTVLLTALITATVSSVISAIVASVVSKLRMVKKATEEAKQEAEELKELMMQNTKMTCRLAIYNDHFSLDEKIEAYDTYQKNGWNHKTKTYMDKQVGCDIDDYLDRHRPKKS
jgi:hypothetical protein